MGGGGGSDVKNAVWMRALVMAGMILGFAVVSYVGLGVVVADMKHHTWEDEEAHYYDCLLYTSPSPRDQRGSRMPSSA